MVNMLSDKMSHKIEIQKGEKFNSLTVIEEIEPYITPSGQKKTTYKCECICGKSVKVISYKLRNGHTKSCGCLKNKFISINQPQKKHGHTNKSGYRSRTYISWRCMIDRCRYPSNANYNHYGGRGIKVCERWENSFNNFLEDMGQRPYGHTIDRIDPNGNYEPNNCRWSNAKQQRMNQR